MIGVFGSRLYGKVDVVPGLFHVETKFGHFNYIPLFPTQSYVILSKSGKSFRGVPIPISARSVLMTWSRLITGGAAVTAGLIAVLQFHDSGSGWLAPAGIGIVAATLAALLMFYKGMTRASFNRACDLGRRIGLNERAFGELHRIYGESAGRGFDVLPASQAAAANFAQPASSALAAQPMPASAAPPTAGRVVPVDQGTAQWFWIRGTSRLSHEEVCVPVAAANGQQAREMGDAQGIDVATVQYQDGRLA